MPHKQKRRRGDQEDAFYDLPPSKIARPLPTGAASNPSTKKDRRRDATADDTPKAFARMMRWQQTGKKPNGLDDGDQTSKKRRRRQPNEQKDTPGAAESEQSKSKAAALKILPNERMADFSARVNQSLPVSGLTHKAKRVEGMKERQTRIEKKIQKRVKEAKKEDERWKEKQEEEKDEAAEGGEVDYWGEQAGKKSKRQRRRGETDVEDDPWAMLKDMRERRKGLHDVVQAPPTFRKPPKEVFKARYNEKIEPSGASVRA